MGQCEDFSDLLGAPFGSSYTTFFLGVTQLLALFGIIVWQQCQQRRARDGKTGASDLMVSPSYTWILIAYGCSSALLGVLNIFFEVRKYPKDEVPVTDGIVVGAGWGIYHMILDGLAVFLCMKGSGWYALRRSFWYALALGVVIGGSQAVVNLWKDWAPEQQGGKDLAFVIKLVIEGVLFVWYLLLIVLPHNIFYRRPAVIFYAGFWTVYRPIYIGTLVTIYFDADAGYCVYLAFTMLIYGFVIPAVVVATLRKDAIYWQGVITKSLIEYGTMKRSPSEADIRTPLLGTSIEYSTAQVLADQMDALDESVCPTVSFAHLKLANNNTRLALLGAGGTARVFKGSYRDEPVAIKMLYCMELTPETVQNFFSESRLLCKLRHPNIVHVSGVCVLPPTICMVMELCKGSMYELLRLESSNADLDWEARLGMAIDCACGVQCLHEQKPPILHMDLKSPNFLVGEIRVPLWTVKDVHTWLGTMCLNVFRGNFNYNQIDGATLLRHDRNSLETLLGSELAKCNEFPRLVLAVDDLVQTVNHNHGVGSIKITDLELMALEEEPENADALVHEHEVPQTVNWTAPEVIRHGKSEFSTAADIYSLAMVLYELLTGLVPFDEPGIGPKDVSRLVLDQQYRPKIPEDTPPEYAKLMKQAWSENPAKRPSARAIKDALLLMRRRYKVNQTLATGKFIGTAAPKPEASETTFQAGRFLAASQREALATASGFSMGSLSNLDQAGNLDEGPEMFAKLNRKKSHARTRSDGDAVVTENKPVLESCLDDTNQVYQ